MNETMYKNRKYNSIKNTILICIATVFFIIGPILMANWQIETSKQKTSAISLVKNIHLRDGDHALKILAFHGFDMALIRRGRMAVPEIYFANLPRELLRLKDVKIKKKLFFSALLPAILKVNQTIRQSRKKLKSIIFKITIGEDVSEADYYWLTQKLIRYKVKVGDVRHFVTHTGNILGQLLNRMNIIPPELALAQAAQESGWGTSRFAQQGNALYGEWTWGTGCGIVPSKREKGKKHRIKCFKTIIRAVDSYVLNLNTHKGYREFRQKRSLYRDDQVIDVMRLVDTLTNYSEEGAAYVTKIKNIIRVNRLNDFKKSRLEPSQS